MGTPAKKRRSRKPQSKKRPEASEAHRERCKRNTAGLRAWAKRYDTGATTFLARETGLTFAAVARVLKGEAQPNPASALAFEAATGGEVSAASLLGIEPSRFATVSTDASPARLCSDGAAE